ncbi:4581_t:CDS:2, partial [Rhizophagus irregularis]
RKQDSTDSPSSIDNGYVDNYMMMKLPSDDDSEDNPMVKSYQKNLDCIFQGKFY